MSRDMSFWGVRGSMPVDRPDTAKYGGHTPCITVEGEGRTHIVLDTGTGVHQFHRSLRDPGSEGWDFHVFFTHYHLDHIIGLPFFKPLFDRRNRFTFYGYPYEGASVDEVLHKVLCPPWFPISLAEVPASQRFVDLDDSTICVEGLEITPVRLEHPQGVAAYRLRGPNKSAVLATDYERGVSDLDVRLDELALGVDILIHDAQYTPAEYELEHKGWGHSTWEMAVEAAQLAGVDQLVFMSHDPDRSDDGIDQIVADARRFMPNIVAAYEGLKLQI